MRFANMAAVGTTLVVLVAGSAAAHPDLDVVERGVATELAQRPDDPALLLGEAEVHEVAGRWDAALAALAHAAAHGVDPAQVAATRGRVLLAAGRPRRARREFDRALARRPDAFAVVFLRGRAALALGRPDHAARDFGLAIAGMAQPTPDHVFAHRDALLVLGRREAAVEALDEGIAKIGPVPSLELAALDLEVDLGRDGDALRRVDRLIASSPRNEAWIARRGELLARAGRPDEARVAYATALELITDRPAGRRPGPTLALEQRLRAALGPNTPGEGTP
jgi:tetratricopeptide (TPR) repeat protein